MISWTQSDAPAATSARCQPDRLDLARGPDGNIGLDLAADSVNALQNSAVNAGDHRCPLHGLRILLLKGLDYKSQILCNPLPCGADMPEADRLARAGSRIMVVSGEWGTYDRGRDGR